MQDVIELPTSTTKEATPAESSQQRPDDEATDPSPREPNEVLTAEDQLALFRRELRATGYAGPTEVAELLHLTFVSRCLDRPINLAILGPSAAGKSHTLKTVSRFHPEDATHMISGGSNLSTVFSPQQTKHAHLVFTEARAIDMEGAARGFLHELVWGKGKVTYEMSVALKGGGWSTVPYTKEGPTGIVVTTIEGLPRELSTRMLQVEVQESTEQTREILNAVAEQAAGKTTDEPDYERWRHAGCWLEEEGTVEVVVPYMGAVVERMPADDVRLRRDVNQVVTLIQAHAFAHQLQRDRDEEGRVVAARADYEAAHRLLAPVFETTRDEVRPSWRETWAAVEELNAQRPEGSDPGEGVTYQAVADASPSIETRGAAKRRCAPMIEAGHLRNLSHKYQDARLVLGRSLPEPYRTLPTPTEVFEAG